jgi:hypothetical protein
MDERRRFPRYDLKRRAWCEGDRFTVWLQTLDASEEGLRVRTSIPPPPGTRLRVTFEEPGRGKVVADAEVVWARPATPRGGMGLRIVSFVEGSDLWAALLRQSEPSTEG